MQLASIRIMRSSILTGVLVSLFFAGCAGPKPEDPPPTGFQKTMTTVGRATWTGTKAVGFGLGYMTRKVGQGLGLVGTGVAKTGGSVENATRLSNMPPPPTVTSDHDSLTDVANQVPIQ